MDFVVLVHLRFFGLGPTIDTSVISAALVLLYLKEKSIFPCIVVHGIKMKSSEYLRGIYLASGLSIKPKTRVSKIDALKEIIRAWGLNPEEILTRDALTRPNRTVIDNSQLENQQLAQLTTALRQQMLKEMCEKQSQNSINSCVQSGSPGEIRTPVGGSKARHACPLHHRASIFALR